jgi:squalene-hopene/tetraprenyl-beta-curcumene cyclase
MSKQVMLVLIVLLLVGPEGHTEEPQKRPSQNPRRARTLSPVQDKSNAELERLFSSSPDEPTATICSHEKSVAYLEQASSAWLARWRCSACHSSYLVLMAGPSVPKELKPSFRKLYDHLEYRVLHWDTPNQQDRPGQGSKLVKPTPNEGTTEIAATAAALAYHDGRTSGKLNAPTQQALDRLWALQNADGAWSWNHTHLAPLEYDDYFGAVFVAVGLGATAEHYRQTAKASKGIIKLKSYFRQKPPPNMHHKVWLLWASTGLDGLMSPDEQRKTIRELIALQQEDGGWNLDSLWPRRPGERPASVTSDGYATGLAVHVLRQAGIGCDRPEISRGLTWIKTHQRASGRWFTPSINGRRKNLLTNAGTALCLMAAAQ